MNYSHHLHKISHSLARRALHSFAIVVSVLLIGTLGMHYLEGLSFIDSFYFMSMIATAQGPPTAPVTIARKIFASLMAFLSVGSVIYALGFIFGPFFGIVWKIGAEHVEKELKQLEEETKLLKK